MQTSEFWGTIFVVSSYLLIGSLACAYAINRGWMQENKEHNICREPVYGPPSDGLVCIGVCFWPLIAMMWAVEKTANGVRCIAGRIR